MALLPMMFSDWWEDLNHPHSLFDQHFGLDVNPLDLAISARGRNPSHEMLFNKPSKFWRGASRYHPFLNSLMKKGEHGFSTIQPDKDNFVVTLDVQQFSPEEIKVKVVNKHVVVEAKHKEKEDEHGWISRQFVRRYSIPNTCDIDHVETHLSSDGILKITAPKKESPKGDERVVKIQITNAPAIASAESAAAANGESSSQEAHEQPAAAGRQAGGRGKKNTVKAA